MIERPGEPEITARLADYADVLDEPGREAAERALAALEEALEEDDAQPPPDPGLPADYTILGILGRGAGGIVYRARQQSLDREVAVKVLFAHGSARDTERLQTEARRLASLHHPGIVQVFEVGRARTGVYLTLELQRGGSLQALLSESPLNPGRVAHLGRQAAEALAYTHEHGVVHLDLKPANVLLDENGNARIADFGLARELDAAQASLKSAGATSGGLLGTPAFMAPEQAADERAAIGERTDVYGLGALLYTCLAGRPPFLETTLADMLHAVRFAEPQRLERTAPGTPPDLAAIVAVAMAKNPGERYPNARALAQDLARYEAGEPVAARPPGPVRRALRQVRRRGRELVIALGAALVALLSVLPFARPWEADEHRGWIRAAQELADEGELRAAGLVLDWLEARSELSAADLDEVRELRARFDPAGFAALHGQEAAQGGPAAAESGPVVGGEHVEAVLDAWIVLDDGRSERLWSGTGSASSGELLRIEGSGRTSLPLPYVNSGFDLLHIAPPEARPRSRGSAKVEAGGLLEERDGEPFWHINDRESWFGFGDRASSTFVDFASDGFQVGGTNLIEAQRFRWSGGGMTLLMFVEAIATGSAPPPAARELDAWAADLARDLEADLARATQEIGELGDLAALPSASPTRRAAWIDRVIGLALVGSASELETLAGIRSRLATAGIEPAALSDGLHARGSFSSVTTTGADLGIWLELAAQGPSLSPGTRIDHLPLAKSMQRSPRITPTRKEWLWIGYIVGALLLFGIALSGIGGVATSMSNAGGALILFGVALDKRVTTPWGSLPLDPLASLMLAASLWWLARWTGRFGRASAGLFALATVQSVLVLLGQVPDVRALHALGFASLALAVPTAHPRGRWRAFRHVIPGLLLTLFVVGALGVGPTALRLTAAYGSAIAILVVLAGTGIAISSRAKSLSET